MSTTPSKPRAPRQATPTLRTYEILVVAFATVLVIDAKDQDEAYRFADNAISWGDLQMDEMSIKRVVPAAEVDAARAHADVVADPED